jgi:hypothetical protein
MERGPTIIFGAVPFIEVPFHQNAFSSKRLFIKTPFHQNAFSTK